MSLVSSPRTTLDSTRYPRKHRITLTLIKLSATRRIGTAELGDDDSDDEYDDENAAPRCLSNHPLKLSEYSEGAYAQGTRTQSSSNVIH